MNYGLGMYFNIKALYPINGSGCVAMENIKEELLNGEKKVGVWGTGYIGYSTMASFAFNGVSCIGTDVSPERVEMVNKGLVPVKNLDKWLSFDVKPLVENGLMRATTNWRELIKPDIAVHMIAIPTEKDGAPYDVILEDVIQKLTKLRDTKTESPPLVIVESTLTPGRTDEIIIPIFEKAGLKMSKGIFLGVAPRRDWFISPDKNLKTLPRIIGGTTPETTNVMKEVLSIVCDTLIPATNHRHAETIKSIENAYRHVEITLANQLSLAYPDLDMEEILKLVGTKWNIGAYHPSFGTGGYCIPLSSQYVLMGAQKPENLTILKSAIESDMEQSVKVADSIIKRGAKKVGILGLSYKGDIKVSILSPTIKIVEYLKKKGIHVKVNDPYYSDEEILQETGVESFSFPDGLKDFDTILIVSDHQQYRFMPNKAIMNNLKNCRLILDNTGVWRFLKSNDKGIEYHVAGDSKWL